MLALKGEDTSILTLNTNLKLVVSFTPRLPYVRSRANFRDSVGVRVGPPIDCGQQKDQYTAKN